MAESVLGTFRVEKELWTKFQELAKSGGSNASKVIVGFIQACIDNSIDVKDYTSTKPKPKPENLNEAVDAYLDKNLDTRIGSNLDACIYDYLEKNLDRRLDERLDKGDIQKMVNESLEIALEPITASVSEAKDYTRSQIEQVREDFMSVKKAMCNRIDSLSVATTQTKPQIDPSPVKAKASKKSSKIVPPTLEAVIRMDVTSMSWGEFHALVGIAMPKTKSRSNADIALEWARSMNIPIFDLTNPNAPGWDYGNNKNFIVKP